MRSPHWLPRMRFQSRRSSGKLRIGVTGSEESWTVRYRRLCLGSGSTRPAKEPPAAVAVGRATIGPAGFTVASALGFGLGCARSGLRHTGFRRKRFRIAFRRCWAELTDAPVRCRSWLSAHSPARSRRTSCRQYESQSQNSLVSEICASSLCVMACDPTSPQSHRLYCTAVSWESSFGPLLNISDVDPIIGDSDLELGLEAVANHESGWLDRLVAAAEQIMTEWRKRRCNNVRCGWQRQQ